MNGRCNAGKSMVLSLKRCNIMMLKEFLDSSGFSFAPQLSVTTAYYTFTSSFKALRAFYGHYTVVEFHVQSGSTMVDSIVIVK